MALKPISDEKLAEVLAYTGKRKAAQPTVDFNVRTYSTWFKLRHAYKQEIPGLPHLSYAKCSNPDCSRKFKPKGAIATIQVNNTTLDMCRDCFLAGYGLQPTTPDPQTSLEID